MMRSAGRQAQMMPMLISRLDQLRTLVWSQVGLLEAAKVTRDRRRRMEMTVTLDRVSVCEVNRWTGVQLTMFLHRT